MHILNNKYRNISLKLKANVYIFLIIVLLIDKNNVYCDLNIIYGQY